MCSCAGMNKGKSQSTVRCLSCGAEFHPWAKRAKTSKYCSLACNGKRLRFRAEQAEEKFWARVQKTDGCWVWMGCVNVAGYGTLSMGDKEIGAHRFSYTIHNGDIPLGLSVCHTCDNRRCVNPDHLFAGTQNDNVQDMVRKGRNRCNPPRGEAHKKHKLTEQAVLEIFRSSGSCKEVALRYNVSPTLVCNIRAKRTWKHLLGGA